MKRRLLFLGAFALAHASEFPRPATALATPPYPPSPVIKQITFAPAATIVRRAKGSDNWPMTWADDDALYTAYGDGNGFEPFVPAKLSLGLARVTGRPADFHGENLRSATGEFRGDGRSGRKASGLLMVDGVLYLLARNLDHAGLAWSRDHGATWTWADWKFTTSFGCPTFLNFGKNYAGARDEFVYVYSPDGDGAYPISSFTYLIVPKSKAKCTQQTPLVDMLWWAYHDKSAQSTITELNYAPLPSNLLPKIETTLKSLKCDDGAKTSLKGS